VNAGDWPTETYDAVFSANTAHIMSWPSVENMFHGVARVLSPGGVFALYGPFNYVGAYTSEGNERFDRQLRSSGGGMGIRDSEAIIELAASAGMTLLADHDMPANNRILVFARD